MWRCAGYEADDLGRRPLGLVDERDELVVPASRRRGAGIGRAAAATSLGLRPRLERERVVGGQQVAGRRPRRRRGPAGSRSHARGTARRRRGRAGPGRDTGRVASLPARRRSAGRSDRRPAGREDRPPRCAASPQGSARRGRPAPDGMVQPGTFVPVADRSRRSRSPCARCRQVVHWRAVERVTEVVRSEVAHATDSTRLRAVSSGEEATRQVLRARLRELDRDAPVRATGCPASARSADAGTRPG